MVGLLMKTMRMSERDVNIFSLANEFANAAPYVDDDDYVICG